MVERLDALPHPCIARALHRVQYLLDLQAGGACVKHWGSCAALLGSKPSGRLV